MSVGRRLIGVGSARLVEQGSTFAAMLFLTRGEDPASYAGAAVLFTWLTVTLTVGDGGAGWLVLRTEQPGIPVGLLRHVALASALGVFASVLVFLVSDSDAVFVAAVAALWVLGGWVLLLRAAAVRASQERRLQHATLLGSLTLFIVVLAAPVGDVVLLTAVALVLKTAVELLVLSSAVSVTPGIADTPWLVLGNQVLNLAAANVDYLMVGVLLGPAAFSIYVIAFRVVSGLVSVGSHAVGRVVIAEMAGASWSARQMMLDRWVPTVVRAALLVTAVAVVVLSGLARLLGDEWNSVAPIAIVLCLSIPWRLLHSLLGSVIVVARQDGALLRLEFGRVLGGTALIGVAASAGLGQVAVMSVALTFASALATLWLVERRTLLQLRASLPIGVTVLQPIIVLVALSPS